MISGNNALQSLVNGQFAGCVLKRGLKIWNNAQLSVLEAGTFDGLTKEPVRQLIISGNALITLGIETFKAAWVQDYVYVTPYARARTCALTYVIY